MLILQAGLENNTAPRVPSRVLSGYGSWGKAVFEEIDNTFAAKAVPTSPATTHTTSTMRSSRRTSASSSVYSIDSESDYDVGSMSMRESQKLSHPSLAPPPPPSPPTSLNDPALVPLPLEPSSLPSLSSPLSSLASGSESQGRQRKSLSIRSLSFPPPPSYTTNTSALIVSNSLSLPEADTARYPSADFSAFYDSYHH